MNREYSFDRATDAHRAQQFFYAQGCAVTLVAFDPSRGLYAFNVLED